MNEPTSPTMRSADDLPPRDHNNPPEALPYDPAKLRAAETSVAQFIAVSDQWVPVEIDNEELAGQLGDQIDGLNKLKARVEATRVAQKEPHLTAGKAVDAAFNPLKDKLDKAIGTLKPKLAVFAKKKADEESERKRKEKEIADRQEADAKRMRMDAENSGSIAAQAEADEAEARAAEARKAANRKQSSGIQSASGGGRTMSLRYRRAVDEVKSLNLLYRRYQENPKVRELLVTLAQAEANAAGFTDDMTIPGVTLKKVESLA